MVASRCNPRVNIIIDCVHNHHFQSVFIKLLVIAQLVSWTLISGLEVDRTSVVQRELGVWTTGAQNVKDNIYYRGFSLFGESV